ncbi:hypothetical protein [Sphingopyxis sp.]|uniref:hypothetical protein n=1 Tax=Sphingopyxis sp. TaxID=1908224 RepID=UPI00403521D8
MRKLAFTATLAALLTGCSTEADDKIEQLCSDATELAVTTLRAREQGMTEDDAFNRLREQKVYGGIRAWAVEAAFEAPPNVSEAIFRGSVFAECKKRGGE